MEYLLSAQEEGKHSLGVSLLIANHVKIISIQSVPLT